MPRRNIHVWCHATFDIPMLHAMIKAAGYDKTPWHFRSVRDLRTTTMLYGRQEVELEPHEIEHHAMGDCMYQMRWLNEQLNIAARRETVPDWYLDWHVMLDLETLGTDPGGVVKQIGLLLFELGNPSPCKADSVLINVDLWDSIKHGLETNEATMQWWASQPEHTQKLVLQAQPCIGVEEAADQVFDFFERIPR